MAVDAPRSEPEAGDPDCFWEWLGRSRPAPVAAATPPEIPRQPRLRGIGAWNGSAVALSGETAYLAEPGPGLLAPLEIPNCPFVSDLAETSERLFALCSDHRKATLLSKSKNAPGDWTAILRVTERSRQPRLAVSKTAISVIGSRHLWFKPARSKKWQRYKLDAPSPFGAPATWLGRLLAVFGPSFLVGPEVSLLTDDELFLGWNFGEFGGALFRVPLNHESSALTGDVELVRSMNPNWITEAEDGAVWVSAGVSHMGLALGQVLRIEDEAIQVVLDETSTCSDPAEAELRLPQPGEIGGLTLDRDGRPLIVVGDFGILRLEEREVTPLVTSNLSLSYSPKEGYSIGSPPVGLAVTSAGLFVATRSLGVFAFLASDDGYEFRQLLVPSDQRYDRSQSPPRDRSHE